MTRSLLAFLCAAISSRARCQGDFLGKRSPAAAVTTGTSQLSSEDVDGTFQAKLVWRDFPTKCLDVKDHEPTNGNVIQIYDCLDWDNDQFFLIPSFREDVGNVGKIRWAAHPEKCIDVKDHSDYDGAAIQLWDCEDADSDQIFQTPSEYAYSMIQWANNPDKCLDVKNQDQSNGNIIQLWSCDAANTHHYFDAVMSSVSVNANEPARQVVATEQDVITQASLSEQSTPNFAVQAADFDGTFRAKLVWRDFPTKCLDVKDHEPTNGNVIQIYDCLDWDNDQFFPIPSFREDVGNVGKIRWAAHPEKCIDIKGHSDYDGAAIQLWDCDDADSDQIFQTPSEYAYSMIQWANHPDKCLDVKNQDQSNGNIIQLWPCDAANTHHYFDAVMGAA